MIDQQTKPSWDSLALEKLVIWPTRFSGWEGGPFTPAWLRWKLSKNEWFPGQISIYHQEIRNRSRNSRTSHVKSLNYEYLCKSVFAYHFECLWIVSLCMGTWGRRFLLVFSSNGRFFFRRNRRMSRIVLPASATSEFSAKCSTLSGRFLCRRCKSSVVKLDWNGNAIVASISTTPYSSSSMAIVATSISSEFHTEAQQGARDYN